MKTEKFSDLLGEIDSSIIDSVSEARNIPKKKDLWAKWIAIAACFVIITVSVLNIMHSLNNPLAGTIKPVENNSSVVSKKHDNSETLSGNQQNTGSSTTDNNSTSTTKQGNTKPSKSETTNSSGNHTQGGNSSGGATDEPNTKESTTDKHTDYSGFIYNSNEKVYIATDDWIIRNYIYPKMDYHIAGDNIKPFCDTVRVFFKYNKRDWMIQFCKGQYGWNFIGSEIGIYICNESNGQYYQRVEDDEALKMSMSLYRKSNASSDKYDKLFSRNQTKTWWLTGFTPFDISNDKDSFLNSSSGLLMDAEITFDTFEQAQAFMSGVANVNTIGRESSGIPRSVSFKKLNVSEYEKVTDIPAKYALMNDGKTVRLCWE